MAGSAGYGTVLEIASTPVAELTNISGPGISVDTIDVTTHDSADAFREFVAGLIDGGEISMEGNLTDTTASDLIMNAIIARAEVAFTVVLPASAGNMTWGGQAIVTGFETSAPHDGKLGFSASMKVTGQPTLT